MLFSKKGGSYGINLEQYMQTEGAGHSERRYPGRCRCDRRRNGRDIDRLQPAACGCAHSRSGSRADRRRTDEEYHSEDHFTAWNVLQFIY